MSWNLNGAQVPLLLNVQEDGGTPLPVTTVVTQTGSWPLTVTYGKTYTVKLVTLTQAQLATLQITTKRPQIVFDPDLACALKLCIDSATFQTHGTYASVVAKTSKPAFFQVVLSTNPISSNGNASPVSASALNLSYVTQWTADLMSLNPNTTYHYWLKATSQSGDTAVKTGTVKTLQRKVEVTFDSLYMVMDSDLNSPCDCTYWFQAGTATAKSYGPLQVSDGQTTHPNVTFTVMNGPDVMPIRVEVQDDDADFGACPSGKLPDWGSGNTDCFEWNSGSKTIVVGHPGYNEEFSSGTSFNVLGIVSYNATVSYTVTYVP